MKKTLSLLISVIMVVSSIVLLVSCGGEKAPETTTAEPTTASTTEATTTAMPTTATTTATTTAEPTTAAPTTATTAAPAVVNEYTYVNNDVGLKFKAPVGWVVGATSPFTVADNSTGNNITIVEEPLGGYQIPDFIEIMAQTLTTFYTQIGYSDVAANEPFDAMLGTVNCTVLPISLSANGVSMTQYMCFIENGESVVELTVTVVDGSPLSTFEAMFE